MAARAVFTLCLVLAAGPALAAAPDGKALYDQDCASCHPLGPHSGPSGPSLKGVVWRKVAVLPDFAYTGALKSVVGSWTPDRLNDFLKNTQRLAPGTSMFFVIDDAADRKAIVRYLETVR